MTEDNLSLVSANCKHETEDCCDEVQDMDAKALDNNETYMDQFEENSGCNGERKYFQERGGSVDQCPECDHWNAMVYDVDIEGFNDPDLRIFCRCCGHWGVYES